MGTHDEEPFGHLPEIPWEEPAPPAARPLAPPRAAMALAGGLAVLTQLVGGRPPRAVLPVVAEAGDEPGPDPIELHLDARSPRRSWALLRPGLLGR